MATMRRDNMEKVREGEITNIICHVREFVFYSSGHWKPLRVPKWWGDGSDMTR